MVGSVIDRQLDGVHTGSPTSKPEAVVRRPDVLSMQRCSSLFQFVCSTDIHVVNFHVAVVNVRRVVSPATQQTLDDWILKQENRAIAKTTARCAGKEDPVELDFSPTVLQPPLFPTPPLVSPKNFPMFPWKWAEAFGLRRAKLLD